jgi:hypothetical protein
MASLVLGVAGGVAGFMIGGPAGASIGFALGSAAGGLLFPPKGPDGPRLNDLTVQSSTYGKGIAIPYGTTRIAGNIIWADKIQEHAHEEGGKGGPSYTTYSYTCSFASSICEGPIGGVTRIWADGLLIYDKRPTNTGKQVGFKSGGYKFYLGTEEQLPDPTIQAIQGDTPAYRGQAYLVITDLQLEKFGNRIPSLSFEVVHEPKTTATVPVKWGAANHMALDPTTGYLYTTDPGVTNVVSVYDPATQTKIKDITLPIMNGSLGGPQPYGIIYVDGEFIVGNNAPHYAANMGWEIVPALGDFVHEFNDAATQMIPGGAYFWPGIPSKSGLMFGTAGIAGGSSWNPGGGPTADPYDGMEGPGAPGPVANVQISPNGVIEVLTGMGPWLDINPTNDSIGTIVTNPDWPSGGTVNGNLIAFNDKAGVLYWGNTAYSGVYEVSFATGVIRLVIPDVTPSALLYNPDSDLLAVLAGDFSTYAPSDSGTFSKVEDLAGSGSGITPGNNVTAIYLGNDKWALTSANNLYMVTLGGTLEGKPVVLKDIVRDLSLRCDLEDADIDVSELTDIVDGFCITHQMAARSAIEPLMQAYFFDPVESDYLIAFRKRGRATVATIPDDDLAAHSAGSEVPDLVQVKRKQEVDLPQSVSVKYINPSADYQTSTQYERRMSGRSSSAVTVELPIVMQDDKAKAVAASALYSAWAERTGLTWATSIKYAALEPTDVAIVHERLVRIVHKKRSGGIIEWEGYADGNTIYPTDSIVQAGAAASAGDVSQTISTVPLTSLQILGTPLLQDTDATPGFYLAAAGMQSGWRGAQVWKSIDGGVSYAPLVNVPAASQIGTVSNALGAWSGGDVFDEINTLTVTLLANGSTDTLASATEEAVLNGANAALVGDEVIQYKRAVLNDDGTYTLSGLLRYRRGTDGVTHAAGERFVRLSNNLVRVTVPTAEIGMLRYYKAISNGGTLAEAVPMAFTYTGADLKPYAPALIGGWRAANGDLTITWVRRTRTSGEWRDGVEVPIGETTEAYDVEIIKNGAVVRTFSGLASPSVIYTAAQRASDGTASSAVSVRVYELSSVIGRGFPGTGTV